MHNCIISLASNYRQEENLAEARQRLSQVLLECRFTRELQTEPFRSSRPELYVNQLLYAKTQLDAMQLVRLLKELELAMGRTAEARSQGIVGIDLDLMLFDETRYHLRDWERPYILALLNEPVVEL